MASLTSPANAAVKDSLWRLYGLVGDGNTSDLLNAFVFQRAEWHAMTLDGQSAIPLQQLRELCGADAEHDARSTLWENASLTARIKSLADTLAKGSKRNVDRSERIRAAVDGAAGAESFRAVLAEFVDEKGVTRGNDARRGKLLEALGGDSRLFEDEFADVGAILAELERRSFESMVIELNEALFVAGGALLNAYQDLKDERAVMDFGDLEWYAYRLLTNEEHAAYLLSRLDSRYTHILADEFQDTNMMQWTILRAWLNAYGIDASKPSVFVVGDPKQSIYRFRRSDPRVFKAALELIKSIGGSVLTTSETRRNSTAIVDAMNAVHKFNPQYVSQSTASREPGSVWRLPLVHLDAQPVSAEDDQMLRDPFLVARVEKEDERRYHEGARVAAALLHAKAERDFAWSDVMLLVKKRQHLGAYEKALRELGIPFVSDRRGGLLESVEVSDLIALLRFLDAPRDDLSLAQVLKSPIFGGTDEELILLAKTPGDTWWERLRSAHQQSATLSHAFTCLAYWIEIAPKRTVHDLIDEVMSQGEMIQRYASHSQPIMRQQAIGNLEAFVEMSLNMDAGRYPSLSRFLETLSTLQKSENESPNAAGIDAAADAVRIMTIHGAKGLEAEVVVVLDANHTEGAGDSCGVICEWSHDSAKPTHFSVYGAKAERGAARDALFEAEGTLKHQEDWNLLYVAMTRAVRLLIISGVTGAKGALDDGTMPGSWYDRVSCVEEFAIPESDQRKWEPTAAGAPSTFTLSVFAPQALPADPAPKGLDMRDLFDVPHLYDSEDDLACGELWF